MMVFNGELDTLFPKAGVDVAYAKLRAVWASRRAGHRLTTKLWPELGHTFNLAMQEEAFAWLDQWLSHP
jgi:hypothetical protein